MQYFLITLHTCGVVRFLDLDIGQYRIMNGLERFGNQRRADRLGRIATPKCKKLASPSTGYGGCLHNVAGQIDDVLNVVSVAQAHDNVLDDRINFLRPKPHRPADSSVAFSVQA